LYKEGANTCNICTCNKLPHYFRYVRNSYNFSGHVVSYCELFINWRRFRNLPNTLRKSFCFSDLR